MKPQTAACPEYGRIIPQLYPSRASCLLGEGLRGWGGVTRTTLLLLWDSPGNPALPPTYFAFPPTSPLRQALKRAPLTFSTLPPPGGGGTMRLGMMGIYWIVWIFCSVFLAGTRIPTSPFPGKPGESRPLAASSASTVTGVWFHSGSFGALFLGVLPIAIAQRWCLTPTRFILEASQTPLERVFLQKTAATSCPALWCV